MPIRILIVEDEFVTLDLLHDYMERFGYEVSGDAMSASEAIEVLERYDTDLVLLDIRIRGEEDGVWLASHIREKYHLPFIFLTANNDLANVRRAADTYPYGYVVKPFTAEDMMAAIEVAIKQYEKECNTAAEQSAALPMVEQPNEAAIFLKDNQTYRKVLVREILYVQAFKNYIEVILEQDAPVVLRSTLYKFMEILPQATFRQIHRSFVINTQHITQIGSDFVMLTDKKIPMGKSYRADFLEAMNFFG